MKRRKLNRIKLALIEKDVKNMQLALALNRNYITVSRWCTNETQPSLETLFDIAEYLNVDVAELLQRK